MPRVGQREIEEIDLHELRRVGEEDDIATDGAPRPFWPNVFTVAPAVPISRPPQKARTAI